MTPACLFALSAGLAVGAPQIESDAQGAVIACARIVSAEQFERVRRRERVEPLVNRVRIDRRGLRWNGAPIDPATLKQYFAITTAMTPVPYLVIQVDRGADAALLGRVRDAIACLPARLRPGR